MKYMVFILFIFSWGIYLSDETCLLPNSGNMNNGSVFITYVETSNGNTTREGESVQLKCVVQNPCSDSRVRIEWFKDSKIFSYSASVILTLSPVNRNHSGQYECGISIAGSRQPSRPTGYRLNVIYGPSKPVVTVLNATFISSRYPDPLVCNVDCNPPCSIVWTRNGTTVNVTYYHWLHGRAEISRSDSGAYRCKASNVISSSTSDPFVINVLVPPTYVSLRYKTTSGFEHENVTVVCYTYNCNPPCVYKWWRGNTFSNYTASDLITDGDTLSFPNLLRSDKGSYTCEAKNAAGSKKRNVFIGVKYTHIEVQPYKPSIKINVGHWFPTIHCRYECYPPCINRVVLQDNTSIPHSRSTNMFPQRGARREDDGVYRCKAVEKRGSSELEVYSDPVRLSVQFSPTSIDIEGNTTVLEHENVTFVCRTGESCNPPCAFKWWDNRMYTVVSEDDTLSFPLIQRTDALRYTCEAKNTVGRGTKSISVEVIYGPSKPMISSIPKQITGSRYTSSMRCSATCNPSCSVEWRVNGSSIPSNEWPYRSTSLTRSHSGTYTCKASNTVSEEVSDPVDVNVLESPKSIYIEGNTTVLEHENVTLVCRTGELCNPPCAFKWWKYVSGKRTVLSEEETLSLPLVQRSDALSYTCEANNTVGRRSKSLSVKVVYAEIGVRPSTKSLTIGHKAVLPSIRCIFNCFPSCYGYQVLKNNVSTFRTSYIFPSRKSANADAGEYICMARQKRGNSSQIVYSETIQLDINYNLVTIQPPIQRKTVEEGQKLTNMICSFECNPSCFNLTLYKNNVYQKLLKNDDPIFDTSLLRSDSGRYYCKVTNSTGSEIKSNTVFIDVQYGPIIMQEPSKHILTKENSELTLVWRFDSNPDIEGITFTHPQQDPKHVSKDDNINNAFSVRFHNIDRYDTGQYTMRAWNGRSSITRKYNITILSVPSTNELSTKEHTTWKILGTVGLIFTGILVIAAIFVSGFILRKKYLQRKEKEIRETYEPYEAVKNQENAYSEVQISPEEAQGKSSDEMYEISRRNRIYVNTKEFATQSM